MALAGGISGVRSTGEASRPGGRLRAGGPAPQVSEREELLELLLERGILRRTEAQPVLSRDGTSARWMLDSLAVTLTPRGAELAGGLILERLRRFDGRQVATYGLTAVPILQSAVMQSGGRYRGLLVRKERKPHGSQKLIEGAIDPDEPTILIDDSIASGMSCTMAPWSPRISSRYARTSRLRASSRTRSKLSVARSSTRRSSPSA